MPIRKTSQGYYWGSQGPFKTREKAESVAQAAYASGYRPKREVKNDNGKKKGIDNKGCWEGYRYGGTVNGKDICTKVKK